MTTPEGKVKEAVKRLLRSHDVYWFCPVQRGYGQMSVDFLCCYRGWFFAIETKAPGHKPTQRQKHTMSLMRDAGAACFVIDGPDSMKDLEEWLIKKELSYQRSILPS